MGLVICPPPISRKVSTLAKRKALTRDQVQAKKDQAERFVRNVLNDPDRADELSEEDLESYAERKKITLLNPNERRLTTRMPRNVSTEKALQEEIDDQQDTIDQAIEILEGAYTPEATRAELVDAVSQAIDVLSGEEPEPEEEDEENGDSE